MNLHLDAKVEIMRVVGLDLADKVPIAERNLLGRAGRRQGSDSRYLPFKQGNFELIGGDAFAQLTAWQEAGRQFDVVYSGCSMDPSTDQLRRFLSVLKPGGGAVFNLGAPGQQGMYYVADSGRTCELLMRVNFMMCESLITPQQAMRVPLEPRRLGDWISANVYAQGAKASREL
eukprot:TRINITY_DN41551_c0_g1_i2.p1 TRINITY_DN41551_c0_g1~~TRINITY_DN41551_c0_g1_i2.p1  ORF type:complete len:174 (+),score=15.05 TRINITY_DN41551_c0_g1_i2:194-715(+)